MYTKTISANGVFPHTCLTLHQYFLILFLIFFFSFRTILTIGKQTFHPVEAGSKKDSKLKAAEAGLLILQEAGKIRNSVAAEVTIIKTVLNNVNFSQLCLS